MRIENGSSAEEDEDKAFSDHSESLLSGPCADPIKGERKTRSEAPTKQACLSPSLIPHTCPSSPVGSTTSLGNSPVRSNKISPESTTAISTTGSEPLQIHQSDDGTQVDPEEPMKSNIISPESTTAIAATGSEPPQIQGSDNESQVDYEVPSDLLCSCKNR